MTRQPPCRFAVAPRFHLPGDWPKRLQLAEGGEWVSVTADLQSCLVNTGETKPDSVVELFRLPVHLRSKWWQLFEQSLSAGGHVPGFEAFVSLLVDFFAFKEVPVPQRLRCDVVVSRAGQRSTLREVGGPALWGVINLGDDATSVELVGSHSDDASVRFALEPGEGFRLPAADLVIQCGAEDRSDPDVLLAVYDADVLTRPSAT
jgi:hypothetical protein